MAVYELDPVCKIGNLEIKKLGDEAHGSQIPYSFTQIHEKDTSGATKEHILDATVMTVRDTILISGSARLGYYCMECSDLSGFKREGEINTIAGLNGRLRWIPDRRSLTYIIAKLRPYLI